MAASLPLRTPDGAAEPVVGARYPEELPAKGAAGAAEDGAE
jgi:hypothetical protein